MRKYLIILCNIVICFSTCTKTQPKEINTIQEIQNEKNIVNSLENVITTYHYDKAIIIADKLNVRDDSSFTGNIIDKYSFGKEVTIYATRDFGNVINNEYNCWYKLSNTEDVWANSLYVRRFPIYISSEEKVKDSFYDRYTSKAFIEIIDIIETNNKKYFIIGYGGSNYDKFQKIEIGSLLIVDDFHYNIIDNKFDNLFKLSENMCQIVEKLSIIKKEYLIKGEFEKTDSEYYFSGYRAIYHVLNSGFIKGLKITNKDEWLSFGLRIGTDSSYLEELFGAPTEKEYNESNNLVWYYYESYLYNTNMIYFEIDDNGKIISINNFIIL